MKLIGIDTGGTFTDLILTDTEAGKTVVHKVPTTPANPAVGIVTGISETCRLAGLPVGDLDHVFHGTTIATNALLEYKGHGPV